MGVYVEPAIIPDVFVSGRLAPEDLGNGLFRFTFYVEQKSLYDATVNECVIVARLVIPAAVMTAFIPATAKALGMTCFCANHVRLVH